MSKSQSATTLRKHKHQKFVTKIPFNLYWDWTDSSLEPDPAYNFEKTQTPKVFVPQNAKDAVINPKKYIWISNKRERMCWFLKWKYLIPNLFLFIHLYWKPLFTTLLTTKYQLKTASPHFQLVSLDQQMPNLIPNAYKSQNKHLLWIKIAILLLLGRRASPWQEHHNLYRYFQFWLRWKNWIR